MTISSPSTTPSVPPGVKARKSLILPSELRPVPRKALPQVPPTVFPLNYRLSPGPSDEEQRARSIEPLASIGLVCAVDYGKEETLWVVGAEHVDKLRAYLRILGRQVHFRPEDNSVYRPRNYVTTPQGFQISAQRQADLLPPIDPRHPVVEERDILRLRKQLPYACGLTILQYGEVELIISKGPLLDEHWPRAIGGLPFYVIPATSRPLIPTSIPMMPYGIKASPEKHFIGAGGCLGLKLRDQAGNYAITTATYGFVESSALVPTAEFASMFPNHSSTSFAQKATKLFVGIPKYIQHTLKYYVPQILGPNPLLGIEVHTTSTDAPGRAIPVGTITKCYDSPSFLRRYPAGYSHNLSLITGTTLPDMCALPGLPLLTEFLPFDDVFSHREKAIFTISYPMFSNHKSLISGSLLCGKTMDLVSRESLLSALRIDWSNSFNVTALTSAVLWRTKAVHALTGNGNANPRESLLSSDSLSALGFSGSVLCVGADEASSTTLIPSSAKVICFQNFQEPFLKGEQRGDDAATLEIVDPSLLTFKGGFRLPDEIYASTIEMLQMQASSSEQEGLVLKQVVEKQRRLSI